MADKDKDTEPVKSESPVKRQKSPETENANADRDAAVHAANEAALEEGRAAVEAYNAEAEKAEADQKADAEK